MYSFLACGPSNRANVCTSEDDNFSPKQAAEAERILLGKGKQVPCEFKTYKGTSLVLFDACLTEEMVNNAVRQVARMVLRIDRIRQSHK